MDDLVAEFLTETSESLVELDQDLVDLEQNPNDSELLGKIFRLVHTIKGTCGFLDLPKLEKVAHHAENVLGRFRDGDLEVTPEYVTVIFESMDVIKTIVASIEETGSEGDMDASDLIKRLDAIYEGTDSGAATAPAAAAPDEEERVVGKATEAELEAAFMAAEVLPVEQLKELDTTKFIDGDAAPVEAAPTASAKKDGDDTKSAGPVATTQTLRVNVDVLEDLMTMVSELVLTRNQLLQILRTQTDSEFGTPLQRLNHVVSDLQEGVMKTRMQPIGNAWAKLPRIIRDLAMELDKKINLDMVGKDTELDRQVLELIKDPLTHMVRNSGDHGIEKPAERVAAGKPDTGTITLKAYHEGGHIIIKIIDDGKGLSTDKIKAKAIQNGLATAEELEEMGTQQIQQFIFKAGFSTAEKVTSVSGRGVGMDVVRTNIEKIGGSIELDSVEGKGSTFTIKIPLTLAIVSALIVEAGKERFAIPQISVRELVMASEQSENQIEYIKGAPVFRLRDHLLPLVPLRDLLKLKAPDLDDLQEDIIKDVVESSTNSDDAENSSNVVKMPQQKTPKKTSATDNRYIVVTQVGTYSFGIIVDRVFDTEEIVVKPVAKILRDIDIFSGNTILGDGTVIMILDPNGIARATGEMDINQGDDERSVEQDHVVSSTSAQKTSLLLFSAGQGAPKAVPLSLVARLENIETNKVERSNGQLLVQYRGGLMSLTPFSHEIDIMSKKEVPVLVFSDNRNNFGLVVEEIVDIIEEHIDVKVQSKTQGLLGSAIINNKTTDVVDVGFYLQQFNRDWFKDHGDEAFETEESGPKKLKNILLVDDSPFFRNMLTPLLGVAGYNVTTVESPLEALELCEKGQSYDVIISDIEMPGMTGFEFAEKIKSGESTWQNTPMVALSSHATPQDIDRGLEAGFEKYVVKFDRDTLLETIAQTLSKQKQDQDNIEAAE